MLADEVKELENTLRATQRKLNLLCSWVFLKFGDDPTLPKSLFHYSEDASEISILPEVKEQGDIPILISTASSLTSSTSSSGIKIVDIRSIIETEEEKNDHSSRQSLPSHQTQHLCHVCHESFQSFLSLKLHLFTHYFVKIDHLGSSSNSTPNLAQRPRKSEVKTPFSESDLAISWDYSELDGKRIEPTNGDCDISEACNVEQEVVKRHGLPRRRKQLGKKLEEQKEKGRALAPCEVNALQSETVQNRALQKYKSKRLPYQRSKVPKRSRLYRCPECEKTFSMERTRRKHMRMCHAGKSVTLEASEKKEADEGEGAGCPCMFCSKVLSSETLLLKHLKFKHKPEVTPQILNSLKPVYSTFCSVCQKNFTNFEYFKRHLRENHPKEYAAKVAAGELGEVRYKRAQDSHSHSLKSRTKCRECGLTLMKKSLATHMRHAHPIGEEHAFSPSQ